jgi:hypothetical protein
MPSDGTPLDRRTVLKRIGTTAAVTSGLLAASAPGAAEVREKTRLIDSYHDPRSVRSAFASHGSEVRSKLVAEGFVAEDFDFGALDVELDPDENGVEPEADDASAGVTAITKDGTTTALAAVSTSSATHEIALFVQPERDEAYALVEPTGGGDRVLVTEDQVSPEGCLGSRCTDSWCDSPCYKTAEELSCDENCENCKVTGTKCTCHGCSCDDRAWCTTECSYC